MFRCLVRLVCSARNVALPLRVKRRCLMVVDGISMLILQSKGYICALSLNLSVDARNSPRCDLTLVGEVYVTDHSCMLLSHDWVAETFLQLHVLLVGPVG